MEPDWDFDESGAYYSILYRDRFPYKVLNTHNPKTKKLVADKLHRMRLIIDRLVGDIKKSGMRSDCVDVFLDIHTDNYLLSEIRKDTGFSGLNKPREVIKTNLPPVGPDKNLRASWRDVFLTINTKTPNITKEELELLVHEIAHTMANHVTWRDDDHGRDFQECEETIWYFLGMD